VQTDESQIAFAKPPNAGRDVFTESITRMREQVKSEILARHLMEDNS